MAAPPMYSGAQPAPPLMGEAGISGTSNWSGDVFAESNAKLLHQQAYGVPGSRTWGEWELILRTDPDVSCALDFTVAQLRDALPDVKSATADVMPDQVAAKAHADFVRWVLLERLEPGWPEVVQQMARGSLAFGFALHELCWSEVTHPTLPGGKGIAVTKLAERLPVSVHINGWLEKDNELYAIRQLGQVTEGFTKRFADVVLPAEKLSLASWNRSGNNYLGFSAFRSVWYLCKIRAELLKLVGVSLTREGAGIPVAECTDKTATLSDEQRTALQDLLGNLVFHENASAVLPAGWTIKWIFSPGANKGHVLDAWAMLGQAVLRQLQAQQMTLGAGHTGSRAVGQVHDQVADSFAQGVVGSLEAVINGAGSRPYTGLVRKLIDMNFGPQPAYPKFTLTLKKGKLPAKEKFEAVGLAVTAGGLTLTFKDELAFREELGLGPIDVAQWEAGRAARQPPAPSGGMPPSAGVPRMPGLPLSLSVRTLAQPFTPARALRPAEQLLDLQHMDSFLNRARGDFERSVRPVVVEMLVAAAPDIRAAMADGNPAELETVKLDTVRLEEAIDAFLRAARAEGHQQVKGELQRGQALKVAKKRSEGDQSMAPVRHDLTGGDGSAAADIEDETSEAVANIKAMLLRRLTGRLRGELDAEAVDAMRTDENVDGIISRTVSQQLDTGAFRGDAGQALTRVMNLGRQEAAQLLGGVDEVEYSAILDGNQCSACEEMDGQRWPFDSDAADANLPPNRDCDGGGNCRCVQVYIPRGDSADDTESEED